MKLFFLVLSLALSTSSYVFAQEEGEAPDSEVYAEEPVASAPATPEAESEPGSQAEAEPSGAVQTRMTDSGAEVLVGGRWVLTDSLSNEDKVRLGLRDENMRETRSIGVPLIPAGERAGSQMLQTPYLSRPRGEERYTNWDYWMDKIRGTCSNFTSCPEGEARRRATPDWYRDGRGQPPPPRRGRNSEDEPSSQPQQEHDTSSSYGA